MSDPTALSKDAPMESPTLSAAVPPPIPPLLPQDTSITSIDEEERYEFAHNYSQEEEDSLRRIATAFKDEFCGKLFPSKMALKTHLEAIGRPFGVYVSVTAERVYSCSRFGTPKSASTQIRNSRSSLPCNCPMRCNFTYTIKSYLDPETLGGERRDGRYRDTPELQKVQVLESSQWHHDNGCLPSYEQYRFQSKKAGTLLKKESQKWMNSSISCTSVTFT
jgi:hypothetical protein